MARTLIMPHATPPATSADRDGYPSPNSKPTLGRRAIAVADAGWFNTENQFREIPRELAETLLFDCADYRNAWNRGERPWSWNQPPVPIAPGVWKRRMALPSGWMKLYPRLGMRPIAREIRRWQARHAAGLPLTLVMSSPYYLYLRDKLRVDRLVYYNIDDYSQYWPRIADKVAALERDAVRAADLTICVSRLRADHLCETVPEAADRIRHLPHGSPTPSIPDGPLFRPAEPPIDIAHLPRPLVGYVGTMEDRVDWAMLDRAALRSPEASFVLLGRVDPDSGQAWQADRERCLSRPNVHAIGWRNQDRINSYIRSFDLGIIPYQVTHPFNLTCCPTKIMDYVAASRPFVATEVPECRLHTERFDVVTPDVFAETVARRIAEGCDDGRIAIRHEWAVTHSCRAEMLRLLDWLG